jgi:diguanylate cyclase (GGDEF)-like protein
MLILIIVAVAIGFSMKHSSEAIRDMQENTEKYIDVQDAIGDMKEGSDYLTEHCRAYIVSGDRKDCMLYFDEVYNARRRDLALETLHKFREGKAVTEELENSLEMSNELMDIEKYAMALATEAYGYNDKKINEYLSDVMLSNEDKALSRDDKIARATEMVFNDNYETYKTTIYKGIYNGLESLVSETRDEQLQSYTDAMRISYREHILFFIIILLGSFALGVTAFGVILPMTRSISFIESNEKLPTGGAAEYNYLATTFNDMQEKNIRYSEKLSFEATHDELTGLYNRKYFENLRPEIAERNVALLIVDVDNFKLINDNYGHAAGDEIIRKVAWSISGSFRSHDVICRIGGDEFAVVMMDMTPGFSNAIRNKVGMIRQKLDKEDGMPDVTVSIGVAFSADAADTDELFRNADEALYDSKRAGKNDCKFYTASGGVA